MNDSLHHLMSRLRGADRAWQRQRAFTWLLRSLPWCVLLITLLLVADVIWHLEGKTRLILVVSSLTAVFGFIAWLIHKAWIAQNPPERTARLLESREPALGSKLINVLQLQDKFLATTNSGTSELTRSLAAQAVEDAAADVREVKMLPLTREPDVPRRAKHAAWAFAGFALAVALTFSAFTATLIRFLDPFGDHPPYSMTRLWLEEPALTGASVLYREGFTVKCRWAGHDPEELFLTAHPPGQPDKAITLPMFAEDQGVYVQKIEDVRSDLLIHAHTKGGWSRSRTHPLTVLLTPQFLASSVSVAAPSYTGLRPKGGEFAFNGLSALKGSQVTFRLKSNRPLKNGTITLTTAAGAPQLISLAPDAEKPDEVTGSFTATDSGRMTFSLTDIGGIPSDAEKASALSVTHDLPPQIAIHSPDRDGFVVQGHALNASIAASDDYGLKTLRLHISRNEVFADPIVREFTSITRQESLAAPLAEGAGVGDIITLFAEAIDTHPNPPHVARTDTRRLTVISKEQYNDFLRQQHEVADLEKKYDSLMSEHQKLLDQQKQLAEQASKANDAKEKDALKQAQAKLNEELLKSAERMEKFVEESPLYEIEKSFADDLKKEAQEIRDSVEQNQRDSQSAEKSLADAAKEHHERMAGAQEKAQEKIEKAIADMQQIQEIMKDFNLFKALYEKQQQITAQSEPYLRKKNPDEADRIAIQSLGAEERDMGEHLRQLAEKLREHAKAAGEKFPKAAESAEKLAEAIEQVRMDHLAGLAAGKMLAGDGKGGHQGAQRLQQEMQALFGQCKGGEGPMSDELDQFLSLSECMKPSMGAGNQFKQMMQSKKFGKGKSSSGSEGMGMGGFMSGNDPAGSQNVYGAEPPLGRVSKGTGDGQTPPGTAEEAAPVITKTDVATGAAEVNRATDAVPAASLIEQYRNLTEAYFERITAPKAPPQPEKP